MARIDIYTGVFRKFGGKRYILQGARKKKRDALLWAKDIRTISGKSARVVRYRGRWRVYKRG